MSILARIKGSQYYQIDPLVLIFLTFSVLVNAYLSVKYAESNMYVSVVNLIFICLALMGLMLHQAFCGGIKFDATLLPVSTQQILIFSAVGFFFVLITQTIIFQIQPATIVLATAFETKLFYLTAAVSEELFFRYYIQTKIEQSLPYLKMLCIPVASLLFTVYHFTIYGANVYALYAVFFSAIILGSIYYVTKRLSVPMIVHILVNFVAS